ncbi:MAG TPA: sigma-54 dependent transcriptional regulator [Candidatus Sulfotelmatobacter sp.]|nr:sigma-54 dependent transcriptional regulator [Candidatus Sulfotelmatobacter sp.]
MVKTILIADDITGNRELIREALTSPEFQFSEADNACDVLRIMRHEPADLVISDVRMPGMSGVDLVKELRRNYPETPVILVTAFGTIEEAVAAMKAGARDYITSPLDIHALRLVVERALEHFDLKAEVRILRSALDRKLGFEKMLGHSRTLLQILEQAARVASTDATVLIQGETGTGKELLARAIHANSNRSSKPFITVNCGAIPRDLLESELFGHVRGSFTGALMDRKGKAEAANGGTLFLDEIGEMSLELQTKVLRLIEHGDIEKVGAAVSARVDIRIVAATHRSLPVMVENGTFREDLYYRLNVIPLRLPSLRQRTEDIPELVRVFFERGCKKHGRDGLTLPERLLDHFSGYRWPGNIRELENTVERIVVLTQGSEVGLADLPAFLQSEPARLEIINLNLDLPPNGISLGGIEKEVLLRALEKSDWNQSQAARYLGISRKTFIYRMHKHNLVERKPLCVTAGRSSGTGTLWVADPPSKSEEAAGKAS